MKNKIQNYRLHIAFTLLGGMAGFLYWRFIGCESGTCPIKSVWYWSTLWGVAMGFLVGDFIYGLKRKKKRGWTKDDER